MPATVLFNLASPCNVLTCFNQILSNYSALKQKSSSLCHNDPNTHNEPPCPFPTMQQVMGLLCQNHQSSMLSIFPLTDTVTLDICMPVLTVISLGWIVWVMTMDTSQQPALSFQKAQHGVKRLTKVISLSIMYLLFNHFWLTLFLLEDLCYGFAFVFYFLRLASIVSTKYRGRRQNWLTAKKK